jgi:hypothetical protein
MNEQGIKQLIAHGFVSAATILLSAMSLLLSVGFVQRDFCTDGLENEGGAVGGHLVGIWTYRCLYTAPFEPPQMQIAVRDHSTAFWVYWDVLWLTYLILACASLVVLLVPFVRSRWSTSRTG